MIRETLREGGALGLRSPDPLAPSRTSRPATPDRWRSSPLARSFRRHLRRKRSTLPKTRSPLRDLVPTISERCVVIQGWNARHSGRDGNHIDGTGARRTRKFGAFDESRAPPSSSSADHFSSERRRGDAADRPNGWLHDWRGVQMAVPLRRQTHGWVRHGTVGDGGVSRRPLGPSPTSPLPLADRNKMCERQAFQRSIASSVLFTCSSHRRNSVRAR